jgi:hypothetical protein
VSRYDSKLFDAPGSVNAIREPLVGTQSIEARCPARPGSALKSDRTGKRPACRNMHTSRPRGSPNSDGDYGNWDKE